MIGPRGGFTQYDNYQGYRGSCRCSWVGPWRGYALMTVEEDVLEHWGKCAARTRAIPQPPSCTISENNRNPMKGER